MADDKKVIFSMVNVSKKNATRETDYKKYLPLFFLWCQDRFTGFKWLGKIDGFENYRWP
jgi:hypothetical protein